ncbi:MAG: hypothetical protein JWR22_3131 [Herminiimonas sp.]|nr:hypothetical protein [Herminiimonas sp.]
MSGAINNLATSGHGQNRLMYLGVADNGLALFVRKGRVLLSAGALYERRSVKTGSGKCLRVLKRVTSTVTARHCGVERRFLCICNATGRELLFKGCVVQSVDFASIEKVNSIHAETANCSDGRVAPAGELMQVKELLYQSELRDSGQSALLAQLPEVEVQTVRGIKRKKSRVERVPRDPKISDSELTACLAARNAGFDPELKIYHFSTLAQESVQTLYRKMANGLCPRPMKRGRSSFWKLSEIETYMSGGWALSSVGS